MATRLQCLFDSNVFDMLIDCPDLVEKVRTHVDVHFTHVQPDEK